MENCQQVCTIMAIIHGCIRCVVWGSDPVPRNAAYVTFGTKGLITKLQLTMYTAVGTTQLLLIYLQDVSANLGQLSSSSHSIRGSQRSTHMTMIAMYILTCNLT